MLITKLLKNKVYNIPNYFRDTQNLPIVLATPVNFTVRDFNNILISSGICSQDTIDTSKWTATFTIPTSAPNTIDENSLYTLTYTADLPNNTSKEVSRLFEVQDDIFQVLNESVPLVLTIDMPLKDNLLITQPFTVDSYSVTLRTDDGNILWNDGPFVNPSVYLTNSNYNIYVYQSTSLMSAILNSNQAPGNLQIEWNYVVNGQNYLKINPVYILNSKGFSLVTDLRMTIDKARIVDIDPNMVWRDHEFLHFVLKGIQRINASNPPSTFDINTIPTSLFYAVSQAAIVELCKSWYIALGQKSFDFQGQDIQLNIDLTQYIQTLMDQSNSWLSESLKDTKTSVMVNAATGAKGFTTISVSPSTNLPGYYNRLWPFLQLGR